MKTLVGVDSEDQYTEALSLLNRLRFSDNAVTLAHVEPSSLGLAYSTPETLVFSNAEIEANLERGGKALLEHAAENATHCGLGPNIDTIYSVGNAAGVLLDMATDCHFDLLALGSGRKKTWEAILAGSVSRRIAADSTQSFLIARNGPEPSKPIRAIFATNFSYYADRCLQHLLSMNPQGIERLDVVTATEHNLASAPCENANAPIRETWTAVGEATAKQIRDRGIASTFSWQEGPPSIALPEAMSGRHAELLVLGARGHGFIERLLVGSVAYHEVAAQPYSVMVIRAPLVAHEVSHKSFPERVPQFA